MRYRRVLWRILLVAGCAFVATFGTAAAMLEALDLGYLHPALIARVQRLLGRTIEVGELKVHLLTRHPSFEARRLQIGNPPWTKPGTLARIDAVEMRFEWPWRGAPWSIDSLHMDHAMLTLIRDEEDLANWPLHQTAAAGHGGLPVIKRLSLRDSRVQLKDERGHLDFDGTLSIDAAAAGMRLELTATGTLNAHAATLHLTGEPLSAASSSAPYHFDFDETSSGSRLQGAGSVAHPFDFQELDIKFKARGNDLLEFYDLTGLKLLATGPYEFQGRMARRDLQTEFTDLLVTSGESDMRGEVTVDMRGGRRRIRAVLHSNYLRGSDLGPRAAHVPSLQDPGAPRFFSDRQLNAAAVTGGDAQISYTADRLDAGPFSFRRVGSNAAIEHGILTLAPSAELLGGNVSGTLKIDAGAKPATAALDLKMKDVRSSRYIEGPLRGRLSLTGPGASVRQFAAAADGSIEVFMSGGVIRAALAELTSVDLRGVGLMLAHSDRDVVVRCGVAVFQARKGILSTERLLLDTEPVLISGSGVVHLDTEEFDMRIEGRPKQMRVLRLHTPLLLTGSLRHPAVSLEKENARVKLIDRGTAADVDCTALDRGLISSSI